MKRLVFIALGCFVLFGGIGCRKEEKKGNVSFKVYAQEVKNSRIVENAYVSVFQNGEFISKEFTDGGGVASFTLPEGHYTAVAEEGLDLPSLSSDTSRCYVDTCTANGPHEFDITEGCELNFVAIMDRIAGSNRHATGLLITTVMRKGKPCKGAIVMFHGTLTDALNRTNIIVQQKADSKGATYYNFPAGKYYIVATWQDSLGVNYTSDSSKTKDPAPVTEANGPQLVEVRGKFLQDSATAVVDLAR